MVCFNAEPRAPALTPAILPTRRIPAEAESTGKQTGASAQQHVGRGEANRGAGPRIAERAFIQVDGPAQAQIHIAIESDEVPRHQRHFVEAAGQDLIDADAALAIAQRDRIRPRADGQQAGPPAGDHQLPGADHFIWRTCVIEWRFQAKRACRPAHPACRPRPACRRRDRALPSRTARFLRPCLRCACERPPRPASGHRHPCAFPTRPAPPGADHDEFAVQRDASAVPLQTVLASRRVYPGRRDARDIQPRLPVQPDRI